VEALCFAVLIARPVECSLVLYQTHAYFSAVFLSSPYRNVQVWAGGIDLARGFLGLENQVELVVSVGVRLTVALFLQLPGPGRRECLRSACLFARLADHSLTRAGDSLRALKGGSDFGRCLRSPLSIGFAIPPICPSISARLELDKLGCMAGFDLSHKLSFHLLSPVILVASSRDLRGPSPISGTSTSNFLVVDA
jgi:hypothetical protein